MSMKIDPPRARYPMCVCERMGEREREREREKLFANKTFEKDSF